MAIQEKDQMCEKLVRKLTMGESLETAEKSHLAECESCMDEVVRILDRSSATEPNGLGVVPGSTNSELNQARPEAKMALEQGRRVFEREFGISLPEDRKREQQPQILTAATDLPRRERLLKRMSMKSYESRPSFRFQEKT